MTRRRRQLAQSLVEFSLVFPILIAMVFGVLDLGRAVFYYVNTGQAASEGIRTAIRVSPTLPNDTDVLRAVQKQSPNVVLAPASECPHGPISTNAPPANTGWLFITQTDGTSGANAPGGTAAASASGGCSAVVPAGSSAGLQVTIKFNFVPVTPVLSQLAVNHIVLKSVLTYHTEY